jgi:hypothetical protein
MRIVALILWPSLWPMLWLTANAGAQQLVSANREALPPEAESILISSCRVVGERLEMPMPNPRVELRIGAKTNAVDSREDTHVIYLERWNKQLFKRAALHVCLRDAERDLVPVLAGKVRDH